MATITISQTTLDSLLGRLSVIEREVKDNTKDLRDLKEEVEDVRQDLLFLERNVDAL